jgi:hypothetical protein
MVAPATLFSPHEIPHSAPLRFGMTEPQGCLTLTYFVGHKMRKLRLYPSNSFTDSNNDVLCDVIIYGLVLPVRLGMTG